MSIKDDLYFLLNKYKIEKDKYLICISDVNFYNRDNIIKNEQNDNLEDFICPICLAILKRPKFCSSKENSHSFCKECIDKYLEKIINVQYVKILLKIKLKVNLKNNFINLILSVYFIKKDAKKL